MAEECPSDAIPMPVEDQATTSNLSSNNAAKWSSERIRDIQPHSSSLASFHTSRIPIHGLPNELLVRIFRLVPNSCLDTTWFHITRVCRIWRSIIIGTPLFWTDIDATKGVAFLCCCLQRSKQTKIRISAHSQVQDFAGTIREICPHVDRIVGLHLLSMSEQDKAILLAHLPFPMPNLLELELGASYHKVSQFDQHKLARLGQCSTLRSLTLRSIAVDKMDIDFDPSTFRSLVELRLDRAYRDMPPSTTTFLQVLTACPLLEILESRVSSPCVEDGAVTFPEPTSTVSLPYLHQQKRETVVIRYNTL